MDMMQSSKMEEGIVSDKGRNNRRPNSPLSPRTRRATDASLKRLRSGTTLQEGTFSWPFYY